jgi:hypothetical protein
MLFHVVQSRYLRNGQPEWVRHTLDGLAGPRGKREPTTAHDYFQI